ncbi:hypothetical protein I302_107806 [Kwoniella bestiolae CBS 10118]|uniref:Uncharacterized protein n=1 Tax=Kwoniella bestiolae CBS 10118 TaxID=1296100 RepID=A0A1B9FXH6_9TREE|nr:hypothetical protein I302_06454 [Kwoniella bestiolae CBS 10118]OCF23472.1 hypothetical protein I302_06454 [Kwoniella bestiolae CBS 10118]
MSAEVEAPRGLSAFPRPTSLYVPDVPRSVPILDQNGYSPFPAFPGGRNRDPYGLNAFLLHPDDSLWNYVDPMPDPKAANGTVDPQRSASAEGQQRSTLPRARSVRKQRSLSMIKKPSPLSQPPVSSGEEDEIDDKPVTLQRRRSNSVPTKTVLAVDDEETIIPALEEEEPMTPKTPKSKKSLKRAFTKARKSVFGVTEINPSIPPVPALPELPASLAVEKSSSSSDLLDPSTPMTSRSNSNYSTISSASSTSSSEGVKTPGEGVSLDVAITGSKLANALQEAGDKKNKGKSWRGWLGGKKNGKLSAKDSDNSGSTTPLSDLSAESTPNSSTVDLPSAIPKVTLTPSPAIVTPPRGATPLLPPSEQLARQHTWASEQLRRVSMRKLTQLRSPSPHPLALSLRRQNSKLPDEVAFSIRSDQRVFPMSVNSHKGLEGDLTPAQGGLWLNIAISKVMIKLDKGEQPDGILKVRKNSKKSIVPRPKGALDFINRPPYEERNMVFYPDNTFSPISMARPGYGVWDLDFSPYILGLSEIYEPSTLSWPTFPRGSTENPNLPAEFVDAMKAFEGLEKSDEEKLEVLKSPELVTVQDPMMALKTLTANATSPASSPKKERPLSSFKPKGRHSQADEQSSESSSEDEEEESEDDDEPLAVVAKRRSQSFQSQSQPRMAHPPTTQARPTSTHIRSLSQPADKKALKRVSMSMEAEVTWKQLQAQEALNTVAKARELRAKNEAGYMERQADRDRIQEKEARRRSSMLDLKDTLQSNNSSSSKHKRNSSASLGMMTSQGQGKYHLAPAVPTANMDRRRIHSHSHLQAPRPETTRARSSGNVVSQGERKRFSSFYEQKSNSTTSFHSNPHQQQHFVHQHHQMVLPPQRGYSHPHAQMGMNMNGQRGSMYGMFPQYGMNVAQSGSGRPRMA